MRAFAIVSIAAVAALILSGFHPFMFVLALVSIAVSLLAVFER